MTNETLEEAADKFSKELSQVVAFYEGAKWQAERMFSNEEVIILLQKYRFDLSSGETPTLGDTTKYWFKQFKKDNL
jgi:hypothetical protein